jgi:hypothetical protein
VVILMKNERVIASWNRIEPSSTADERMRSVVLAYARAQGRGRAPGRMRAHDHLDRTGKEQARPANRALGALSGKRLAPIAVAACLVLVAALVGVFGSNAGWFGGKVYTVDLGNSGTLDFPKADGIGAGSFAWDIDWGDAITRELTVEECEALFGGLPVTDGGIPATGASGFAIFRSTDGALLHFEGAIEETAIGEMTIDAKIILSAHGHPLTDTIIGGNESRSEINDIPVTAGYSVTDANSRGIRNIIYFASFDANGATVLVELGGAEADSDALRAEIASIIDQLTQNPPRISEVTG